MLFIGNLQENKKYRIGDNKMILINGKRYRLKENIKTRIQGIILIAMSTVCLKVDADGAAIVVALIGIVLVFGKIEEGN
jgi:hypothetical protein